MIEVKKETCPFCDNQLHLPNLEVACYLLVFHATNYDKLSQSRFRPQASVTISLNATFTHLVKLH